MNRNAHHDDSAGENSQSDDAGLPTWPLDAHDPDAAALREGWSALDQLVRDSNIDRWSDFDAARLARSIEATLKNRRRRRTSFALAAAALVAVGVFSLFRSPTEELIAEPNAAPVP